MLTILLACIFVFSGQSGQPQANSGTQPVTDPSQMSLAERAAAARKASAERANHGAGTRPDELPPLTPEQRGAVRGNVYVNDALHLRIALVQWQPLTQERMAFSEETGHRLVNPDAPVSSPYRVLWIGDNAGRNVAVTVLPALPDAPKDLKEVNERMKKVAIRQLAMATDVTEYDESLLLGDTAHPFAGFRISSTIQGQHLVQSSQQALLNGLLVTLTVSGNSDQDVSDALRTLKAAFVWTKAGA